MKVKISKITISWALYLIISSAFMRQVLNYLLKNLGKTGVTIMLWFLFLLGGVAVFFCLYKSCPAIWRIFLFLGILAAGLFYAAQIEIIEERLHLINFGLLGWLIIKDIGKFKNGLKEIGFSFLFCLFVAIIEETFQWWLPYRVGEVRDLLFAGIGSVWGISLFLISLNPGSK